MANQIQLIGGFRREEALASGGITPGHLLEITSATAPTVKVHATEGGYAERAFAVEDALQGQIVSHAYLTTERVSYNIVEPGAVVNAMIQAGQTITIGERLISGADGTLIAEDAKASSTTIKQIIAVAVEALDLSDSDLSATLCAVRVI